ncbi:MAG TPA: hypothetical protein VHS13_01515 [Edaphobacter sp.]|jgi:hypothetical protein|nr:hypothetical protein [Edaphobacter sp.]
MSGQAGFAQQPPAAGPKPKPKTTAKPAMAVWSPEVQKTLGVTAENFNAEGLNKLTPAQLTALLISARPDPRKGLLTCPASGTVPSGTLKVLVTVAGDDPTGAIATAIRNAVGSLSGVEVVDSVETADRALHVVVQEQTVNKRTIGFTASYLTATPCSEEIAGKKTDVELKGTLGTYSNAKGPGLAKDLSAMLEQDLQQLRTGGTK